MRRCRDYLSLLLVLALVLGAGHRTLWAGEMQRGAPSSNLAMSAMDSDISMSGLCDKCAKKGSGLRDCFGTCFGAQVIMPSIGFVPIWADATRPPFMEQQFRGSSTPPDLPPPKLTVLS
jgi:hypothetical protein